MSQVEVEIEEAQSFEEMVDEVENKSPTGFIDVDSPEDLIVDKNFTEDSIELLKYGMIPSLLSGFSGAPLGLWKGIDQYLSLSNEIGASIPVLGGITASIVGAGALKKLSDKKKSQEDKVEEVKDQLENWHELPGQVNLGYLVDKGLVADFERPYREWLDENLSEWSKDAYLADTTKNELDNLGIDEIDLSVDPQNYGTQKVYMEKLEGVSADIEDEEMYEFILEIYDDEELINVYWGITDDIGRKLVQNNDAVKTIDEEFKKFTRDYKSD